MNDRYMNYYSEDIFVKKQSGKTRFSLEQYVDIDSLTEEDRETVQLLLKVPRYFRDTVKEWSSTHYFSMTDMIQDAAWRLINGHNYQAAAEEEILDTIKQETQDHYRALVSTIKSFQENIERLASPIRKATGDIDAFRTQVKKSATDELIETIKSRKRSAQFDIIRALHFYPSLSTSEISSRVADSSGLPIFQIHEVIQGMVSAGLIEPSGNTLRILPLL